MKDFKDNLSPGEFGNVCSKHDHTMDQRTFYEDYLPEVLQNINPDATESFHPHLSGNRFSMTRQRGVFSRLTLATTKADLIRAIAKGIMQPMVMTLAECQKHIQPNKSVFLTGGGANGAFKQYKEQTVLVMATL